MKHLPPELLRQICLSPPPFFYQHLSTIFWDVESLRKFVSGLTEDGVGHRFVKYARKLSIVCLNQAAGNGADQDLLWQLEGYKLGLSPLCQYELATKDTFPESHLTEPNLSRAPGHSILRPWSSYNQWERDRQPLAALIVRLSHLGEIDFFIQNDIPIILQEAILQHHPKCRLNLWWRQNVSTSVPRSKNLASPRVRDRISFSDGWGVGVDLLNLQALHTLSVQLPRQSDAKSGWIEVDEMIHFLVLAPNLKHLLLKEDFTRHHLPITMLQQEWHNLAVTTQPVPIFSLQSISLAQMGPHEDFLLKLADIVDLSRLISLQIDELFDSAMLGRVAALFPNLERLFVYTNGRGWCFPDAKEDHNIRIAGILEFNPLKYLYLCGIRSPSSLYQITQRHGLSLKGLIIELSTSVRHGIVEADSGYKYPELDALGISQLAKSCPQLKELRLTIKRSMGSPEECEIYKALGNFSTLHSLVLDLHFDPRPRPVYSRQEIKTSVLQKIYLNAAMDERLALQIWHLVSSNQASLRLQNLRIAHFGLEFLPNDEYELVYCLCRSFLITRYNFQNGGYQLLGKLEKENGRYGISLFIETRMKDAFQRD